MHDEHRRIEDRVERVLTVAPRPFRILTDRFTRSAV